MKVQNDMLGRTPKLRDLICFNPPYYKGVVIGECVGFTSTGLPKLINLSSSNYNLNLKLKNKGFVTPKTGFVIVYEDKEKRDIL